MTRHGTALVVVALVLLVAPTLLLGWLRLRSEERLADLTSPPLPVIITIDEVAVDDLQGVNLSLVWGEAFEVYAPPWTGTVTEVRTTAEDELSTGDLVVAVDGVARLAAASEVPFWRPLRRNDTGEDVASLQLLLQGMALYEGELDGQYGPSVVRGVNQFAERLGVVRPQGTFDPAWIVWLPFEPFPVDRVEAVLGRPAPNPGEVLLVGPSSISELAVADDQGRPLRLGGEWLLEVDEREYEVVDGELTADALDRLTVALDRDTTDLFGRVRRVDPVRVVEIPATAVTSSPGGALCVWMPRSDSFSPVHVTLDGGRVARVIVSEGLNSGDQILVNPGEVLEDPTCR